MFDALPDELSMDQAIQMMNQGQPSYAKQDEDMPDEIPIQDAFKMLSSGMFKTQPLQVAPLVQKLAPSIATPPDRRGVRQLVLDQARQLFGEDELPYLDKLIMKESGYNPNAQNPKSTAFGLFQFLDSTWGNYGYNKSASPIIQTRAGLDYIKKRYGSPSKALSFHLKNNWY